MNINQQTITQAGITAASALGGAMASRVVASKLDAVIKKPIYRHSLVALVGIALIAAGNTKETSGKIMQSAGTGIAATQLSEVLKLALTPKDKPMEDGILKTAVGLAAPETVYVESTTPYDYYDYEEVPNDTEQTMFLSGSTSSSFAEV
ncbi:hypothetical protein [Capnocytophaga sp. oral taxon 878]|uniref:hypothetical protein n=1 Tax=Capnocytophaga sp. oral taxon 878 TaxID=1316596 RepID=UPI00101AE315|nr:hypothetical protein [Capnocytophaga sp. oral taxon 878]